MSDLRRKLYSWRAEIAEREGVELFRVLPSATLEAIAALRPKNREELLTIKGIKEAKASKYGDDILAILGEASGVLERPLNISRAAIGNGERLRDGELPTYSVSVYLDILNRAVGQYEVRVSGETLEVKSQGNYTYFSLLDPVNRSVLRVMAGKMTVDLSGVSLTDGIQIAVSGRADIYKPRGTLTFHAQTLELVGEGALKKAYEELKKKLLSEGLFSAERKREIPEYPSRIGLLTSKTGAVIHDFESNLGKHGYKIRFKDIRVEGAQAVKDILSGIRIMKREDIDVLVLIRGGGSMESLQAFNNELVVRAISEFPVPVICAIGHDRDIPLAQLAADHAPSTPTACTELLNHSWRDGVHLVRFFTKDIVSLYHEQLWIKRDQIRPLGDEVLLAFREMSGVFLEVARRLEGGIERIGKGIVKMMQEIQQYGAQFRTALERELVLAERALGDANRTLHMYNPARQLKLGYSIISRKGRIIRSTQEIPEGGDFEARLSDGTLRGIRKEKSETPK